MRNTVNAAATAAVRATEATLLTEQDMERMISAKSVKDALAAISAKGLRFPETEPALSQAVDNELQKAWDFITECADECGGLEILLYKNDFHNLKAALKSLIANSDPKRCFVYPSTLNLDNLAKTVSSGDFDELPKHMTAAAEEAYRALTENGDGQLAEVIADSAALKAMQTAAKESGNAFLKEYAELVTVCADIKTAYRSALAAKREPFLDAAIAGSDTLSKEGLTRAALRGADSVISHLENSGFEDFSEALKQSAGAFEKLCDNKITELAEEAKTKAFGIEPLAAYYLAKEAEVKNLRMILVCKGLGVSAQTIKERTRKLYA